MDISEKEKALIRKEFGQKVEWLIYQKFKSKDQFMRETGFHKKSLHDILTGLRDTHLTMIYRLAKALGVKPRTLFPDEKV